MTLEQSDRPQLSAFTVKGTKNNFWFWYTPYINFGFLH